jgi:hypothetical protein
MRKHSAKKGLCHTFFISGLRSCSALLAFGLLIGGCATIDPKEPISCISYVWQGLRPIATDRATRFLGKVEEDTARCRGGNNAVNKRQLPWVDWQNYWAAGDAHSKVTSFGAIFGKLGGNGRGIRGALLDLEYQRMEMITFNLFDNSGTYQEYVLGRDGTEGSGLQVWNSMRLPNGHPYYDAVGGAGPEQLCHGTLIRFRTLTGICNDITNPLMGSTGQPFARNVQFETTFPDLGKNELVKNRHGDRLGLLKPDPQVISRKLFTRMQSKPDTCMTGSMLDCDYEKAPFFNVLAAFWIQFMTHDWFSHLYQGDNSPEHMAMGCATHLVNNIEIPLSPDDVGKLGCRPDDLIDKAFLAEATDPPTFTVNGTTHLSRAYRTTHNNVTAWWDASQIYGYDDTSRKRVKRDPNDPAKLRLDPVRAGDPLGYLPVLETSDPKNAAWYAQEATAFPDNWSIGLSLFHNVFAREHNRFVEEFRKQKPDDDSGLRDPTNPERVIKNGEVTDDELFEIGRLVIAAEIAKIHTTEWTTQLLYDEPLYLGMNANWHGLGREYEAALDASEKVARRKYGKLDDTNRANQLYSAFAARSGIFGMGNRKEVCWLKWFFCKDIWTLNNNDHINGGVKHFGSPFNFPEEFVTVYRLHTMVPDLIEYTELGDDPHTIRDKIPVLYTFRGKATKAMRDRGLANWALSMGRQQLGRLTLQNHPQFLQNLPMDRFGGENAKIDVAALDLIRDRERGVPRFNEFRRQYGLKTLTSFDDFVDTKLDEKDPEQKAELERQRALVETLREVYGTHACKRNHIITTAQMNDDGSPINDCLGHENGQPSDKTIVVDNIEDVDTVVGWLAEFPRPHGFAISETQFQVFILNASRRLFSDRFFTSSFRPEFYTHLGVDWVTNNGPTGRKMEPHKSNGHEVEVSPLKRVLQRTIPELEMELEHVINVFDPWTRDRGEYYTLQPPPDRRATP